MRMPSVPRLPWLIGRSMQPLPLAPLQLPLALILRSVVARHSNIFERLGPHACKRFGIEPTDLPFAFVLEPHPRRPTMTAVRSLPDDIPIRIAGPMIGLLGLVDGAYDGDALFFSRDLVIEGDVEAVLALRNALDDADVDLVADAAALFGPLAPLGQRLLGGALSRLKAAAGAQEGSESWN
ncbi:Predicted lipid carrier protein YhbT, contains SCP2 domain [Bradyrhizobium canariense]|uniref:Predicted lipid carrier protein YhbT, contains SCP2 domain n=2 Tax=Bradyrhizobium canariense TaxID=255045 RepID=A0A1H2BGV1_9BRAD|nr:Predicted lipid carrier protein YhbT, contains SCP2 domain [Bradyrhizobium canariense]